MNVRPTLCALAVVAAGCVDSLVGADPPQTPASVFDVVWKDFDRNYAFFGLKHVDWNAMYTRYKPQADAARTLDDVGPVIGAMFGELRDPHVDLAAGSGKVYHSVTATTHTWFNPPAIFASYVPSSVQTPSRNLRYGLLSPEVGYVWIGTFGGSGWPGEIDDVLRALSGAKSIVLDIRNNGGGSSENAEAIAGRFVDQDRVFSYVRWRNGPSHDDLSDYVERRVAPAGQHFAGRIVVLTNRFVVSASEDFVLALRSQPGVRFVGDTTAGGMGNPMTRELPNGWVYRLPQWIQYGASKEIYEGIGIAPDDLVRATAADSAAGRDAQLERALSIARPGG